MPGLVVDGIEAIFFDMNGTLRRRVPHAPTQRAAAARMLQLLGKAQVPDDYWDTLTGRLEAYRCWAQSSLVQLSEEEIWTGWMLPDEPAERVAPIAAELMLAWSERKGRTVPCQDAQQTLAELHQRGYRLGVISNTMSTLDIPRSLETFGWEGYFEAVILACGVKARKPAPEPFLDAARALNVAPAHCAYLGNRFLKDVVGCKRAGFALGLIIDTPEQSHPEQEVQSDLIDAVIHSLGGLLEIFPPRRLAAPAR